jgi:hypothetical protein
MIPLGVGGPLLITLIQSKTPPDMQGRIFSSLSQMGLLASTTSFLLTGWLVDHWLEPAVNRSGWSAWAPVVGSQPGAGMGLLLFFTGLLMLASTLAMLISPAVRKMEISLPDYAAEEPPSDLPAAEGLAAGSLEE